MRQITLSQCKNTALIVNRLQGLRDGSDRTKVGKLIFLGRLLDEMRAALLSSKIKTLISTSRLRKVS